MGIFLVPAVTLCPAQPCIAPPERTWRCSSGGGGCGARFVAWDFISGGENVTSILVRKDCHQLEHLPGHWADWMLDVQETLEADGDLLLKVHPRVIPSRARGTKHPRDHSDSSLGAFSPYSKFCTLSPENLRLQRHHKFAARKIVFPISHDCFELKGEFLEDVLIPIPGPEALVDSITDAVDEGSPSHTSGHSGKAQSPSSAFAQ